VVVPRTISIVIPTYNRVDQLRGVLVWMPDIGETLFARTGQVETGPDGSAELTLRDASLLRSFRDEPQLLRFDAIKARLPQNDPLSFRGTVHACDQTTTAATSPPWRCRIPRCSRD